jgi:hypothetical protein
VATDARITRITRTVGASPEADPRVTRISRVAVGGEADPRVTRITRVAVAGEADPRVTRITRVVIANTANPTSPKILNVVPRPGLPLPRWEKIEFDVIDEDSMLAMLKFELVFPNLNVELVHTKDGGFEEGYAVGSSKSAITNGFHFVVARQEGWIDTPVRFRLTVEDAGGLPAVLEL